LTSTCQGTLYDGSIAEVVRLDGDASAISDEELERFIASFPALAPVQRSRCALLERATNKRYFVYLPQSFPGIVWHQQLAGADAAAFGAGAGAGAAAGENRESRNAKRVSMGVKFSFFLR
jgi:hypothetical protein